MSLQIFDFVMNTKTNLLTDATSQKQIVWLASYTKSGNTWFRSFLTALLKEKEVDLNQMATDGIFSGKNYVENILDLNSDYLSRQQIESYQRIAFTHLSATSKKRLFIKIHDFFLNMNLFFKKMNCFFFNLCYYNCLLHYILYFHLTLI
jgi:hypothetical protein